MNATSYTVDSNSRQEREFYLLSNEPYVLCVRGLVTPTGSISQDREISDSHFLCNHAFLKTERQYNGLI